MRTRAAVLRGAVSTGVIAMAIGLASQTTFAEPVQAPEASSTQMPGNAGEDIGAEVEIEAFVQEIMKTYGGSVAPVVDREKREIFLGVDASLLDDVKSRAGDIVGGLRVRVGAARFTPDLLDAAILRIAASDVGGARRIQSYSVTRDGSAVIAHVAGLASMSEADRARMTAELQDAADGRVILEEARKEGDFLSRADDSTPWFGGGFMIHPQGAAGIEDDAICSTGFAVLAGAAGRLLSAGHCVESGGASHPTWDWRDGTRTDLLASATAQVSTAELDSMLMDPVGGTGGQVHGGPWNATASSTSRYHLSVNGAAPTFVGERVCTSGANSGEHCGLEVYGSAHVACPGLGVCHRWRAWHLSDGTAGVSGDSGGPVYYQLASNADRVGARGIISRGGFFTGPCGTRRYAGGTCYNDVLFIGIMDILDYWNVAIETS